MTTRAEHAEHEAAHVGVGLALGLPLKVATLKRSVWQKIEIEGFVWFGDLRNRLAHGVMACAGVVWEARPGGEPKGARGDLTNARFFLQSVRRGSSLAANVQTGCKLAAEIMRTRQRVLARVARELCDRDLRPAELAEMVVGE
jgi:hypothetical protein